MHYRVHVQQMNAEVNNHLGCSPKHVGSWAAARGWKQQVWVLWGSRMSFPGDSVTGVSGPHFGNKITRWGHQSGSFAWSFAYICITSLIPNEA